MKQKKKRKRKIRTDRIQALFCIVSSIFIIGCCIFYGSRLIKYYRIYNPKSETGETLTNLASSIISSSKVVYEGDGLYSNNGNYVYKGENVNNYIMVSNMLFRILKINSDRTMDIVLDEYINRLDWDSELESYQKSDVNKYLNDKFLKVLDQDILEKTVVCDELVKKVNEATCDKPNQENYVKLLGISDFLNSISDNKSYLANSGDSLWLYNHNETEVWHTNGTTVALDEVTSNYGIKPVVTLKNNNVLVSGDGSINSPYRIINNSSELGVGTYLDINDDVYIIYEVGDDYYKIQSNRLLKDTRIFDDESNDYSTSSLKEYLEKDYLENISYSKLLKEVPFANNVKSKVGILTNDDFKFNSSLKEYFLSDKKESNVYLYNASLISSRVNVKRGVRPCLGITKDLDIISGNGSKMAPFIVEV